MRPHLCEGEKGRKGTERDTKKIRIKVKVRSSSSSPPHKGKGVSRGMHFLSAFPTKQVTERPRMRPPKKNTFSARGGGSIKVVRTDREKVRRQGRKFLIACLWTKETTTRDRNEKCKIR
ncbi:hypothetical protein CDAR_315531 [Caerostris darwini]|uniref:Uncharacterized protein n=1 Tax=Caerostris darwini TaxID=1538125 RepID=A0AAV4TUD5_9ARAC|nr:hypothetical protein CDAR_315531 [Caerostris darwini]